MESNQPKNKQFPITAEGDVIAARQCARDLLLQVGFDRRFSEEVAIVVSELAANIVRHVGRGQVEIRIVHCDRERGVEIVAQDDGKGIEDVACALTDGFSTGTGLGYGLGAVNRLMDQLDIASVQQGVRGTQVRCVRWATKRHDNRWGATLGDIGICSRAKPGEVLNGDAYVVVHDQDSSLVAVIDGIGHGPGAHHAAMVARHYLETHSKEPLERLIAGASHSCQSTQGAVISLVKVHWAKNALEQIGVGNVDTRLLSQASASSLSSNRGILGTGSFSVRVNRKPWNPRDLLVLCSDGVNPSWEWRQFPEAPLLLAQQFARELFETAMRTSDDATVLVMKYVSEQV